MNNVMNIKKNVSYSSRTADKFVVRLPDGMRNLIAEVARHQHRSMNSEIIARLENSLQQDRAFPQDPQDLSLDPDCSELSQHELELLQRFRQLQQRQQSALLALISDDKEK